MKKYIGCKMIEAEPCKAWKNTDNNKIGLGFLLQTAVGGVKNE